MSNFFDSLGTFSMQVTTLSVGILALVLVAVVLAGSTWISHRNLSWKASFGQGLGSLLWASPVIASLAFVAVRILPHFQFSTNQEAVASGSPVDSDDFEDVKVFPDETVPVSFSEEPAVDESLPEWTTHSVQRLKDESNGDTWRIVVKSGWEGSVKDARRAALEKAAVILQKDFDRHYPGGSAVPHQEIQEHAVKAEAIEEQVHNDLDHPFSMYKVHWQVEVSPESRAALSETWKEDIGSQRAWLLLQVMGLFTLIAACFAGYFKLDKRSNGTHRFRLKFAAAALMTAGALGVLALLPAT